MAQTVYTGTAAAEVFDARSENIWDIAVFRGLGLGDVAWGGAGNDRASFLGEGAYADLGAGNDLALIVLNGRTTSVHDSIDGGTGTDTLNITLNSNQLTAGAKAELTRLAQYLDGDTSTHFVSDILHLDMVNVEKVNIRVDGVVKAMDQVVPLHGTGIVFMTGSYNPWGSSSPDDDMTIAFGAGHWTKQQGFDASVLSLANKTVYIDGGDGVSDEFGAFIGNNIAQLENFVATGGHLFINAARWTYNDLDVGFGAQLHLDGSYSQASGTGHVVDAGGDLANGPAGAAGTDFNGNYFSHDTVTGTGYTTLMTGQHGAILIEKAFGLGTITVGSLTASQFHRPSPQADILFANILHHVNDHVFA